MSKLDEILDKYGEKTLLYEAHDKWIKAEAKAEIKSLMLATYNRALKIWIDKEARNLDEAFDKAVEEL